jgi:uncharacterized membrane protein (DUF4010 family)
MLDSPLSGAITAVLIGLLLGLERERSQRSPDDWLFAGIRTFPLLTLSGFVAAHGTQYGVPWALPVTLLVIGALAVAAYVRAGGVHVGATTEAAAIFAPLLGALVAWGQSGLAASMAILVTLLLTMKSGLHRLAGAVTEEEIVSILKFGIVAVILVPLLPETAMGPYGALVPRKVGIVVVILSAISLGGYLLVRILGGRSGWSLAGLMGGLASSTAVTLSLSTQARGREADEVRPLAVGIVLASTVLYVRALMLVAFFDGALAARLVPRLLSLFLAGLVLGALAYRGLKNEERSGVVVKNPTEIGKAILLGLLFSAILIGARAVQAQLGPRGIWVTGLVGGFVDVDSVIVATADLRRQGLVSVEAGASALLLATVANLTLKGLLVIGLGGRTLARRVGPAFLALAALTVAWLGLDAL